MLLAIFKRKAIGAMLALFVYLLMRAICLWLYSSIQRSYFEETKDDEYPLTYKYSPSEWFSETITKEVDPYLYENTAFNKVSSDLLAELSTNDFSKHKTKLINVFIDAIKICQSKNIFKKSNDLIYLFIYLWSVIVMRQRTY